jgi:hypothetical protein
MWSIHRHAKRTSEHAVSELLERIQRLEREQTELHSRLQGEDRLRILATHMIGAEQAASVVDSAIENFAQAMIATLLSGRAVGMARSRKAWRYFDGTFMPESAKLEAYFAGFERYACGGRARAAGARRSSEGTFLLGGNER